MTEWAPQTDLMEWNRVGKVSLHEVDQEDKGGRVIQQACSAICRVKEAQAVRKTNSRVTQKFLLDFDLFTKPVDGLPIFVAPGSSGPMAYPDGENLRPLTQGG